MAAKQMKKMTGHLACPICCELYKNPKYLPCYHSYCEACLTKLQGKSANESSIACPECRRASVVPAGGVKDLPNNFFINRLLDEIALKRKVEGEEEVKCDLCVRRDSEDPVEVLCLNCSAFLCSRCTDNHKYSRDYQDHNMMPLNEVQSKKENVTVKPKAKFALCQEHEIELNFYCETCEQLVCHYCIMKDHLQHEHDTVKKVANKYRQQMDDMMKPVEKMIEGLSTAHNKVHGVKDEIGAKATSVDKEIDVYYEKVQRQLLQRLQQQKDDLKTELHKVLGQKQKEASLHLEKMEHSQAELESVKELNSAVKRGSDQEALLMKKQVMDNVKRLGELYDKLGTEPVECLAVEFECVKDFDKSFPQFGKLYIGPNISVANSEALNVPKMISKVEMVNFNVVTKDRHNHICHKEGSDITSQAQSSRGDVIPVETKDNKDGSYSASFIANHVGDLRLSVTINKQHIKGSPYLVNVHRNYRAMDKPNKIVDEGGLKHPRDIAFGKDGVWAVGDDSNHCVWMFDSQDQQIRKIGSSGNGNGQFNYPLGVAFDPDGHLYVTDYNNNRVQKFNANGDYLLQFDSGGSGHGKLNHPLGIVVHNGRVYITECASNRISVFQCGGQFCKIFGSGHLSNPYHITVTNNDQLLVANYGHHCISIFTLDGAYVGKFGEQGTGRGKLNSPTGITTDKYGFILVLECGNCRVSVFDKDGVFVHCFGSRGSAQGQFSSNGGLAISNDGKIYITDHGNNRIQIFSD
ncbi:tripartite motif-containing protein 2-like [Dysidea avara]|uniref:tripartite motif-containing protein 2-like n=1 Tax=Dysidea avara TaxID=196820 RepID=UPI003317E1E0